MVHKDEPLRRLYGYLGKCWPGYAVGTILQIGGNGSMQLILAWMLAGLSDSALHRDLAALYATLVWSLLGILTFSISVPFAARWRGKAVERSISNLRQELFDRLQVLPMPYFEHVHSGDIVSRLTNDISAAKEATGDALVQFLSAIVTSVICGLAMWRISWKLAVLGLNLAIIPLWFNRLTAQGLQKANSQSQENLAELNSRLKDLLAGFPVVKALMLESRMTGAYEEANRRARESGLERVRLQTTTVAMNDMFSWSSFLALLVVGSYLMVRREISPGSAIGAIQLFNGFQRPIASLGELWVRLQTARAAVTRVFEVLDHPGEQWARTASPGSETETMVSLQNVTFAFDSKPVLRDFSLSVPQGQVVALVGPSGGGKSTILKLLIGFYQLEEGSISVAGRRLTDYGVEELRAMMAFVPQEAYLYAGTISDNIACGKLGATEDEIMAAARAANAHGFIMQLPDGYQTQVGERGAQLSGGQRQRIAIARAILKDAPILLLDEATSSLDSESERLVQEALERLMVGRTTLVIAHRLSTIRRADCIHVVVDGQIVESGTHEELMAFAGVYRHLSLIQAGAVA